MEKSISGYGVAYESRISKKRARAFALMYPLPPMGSEICVAVGKFNTRLYLQNVSGVYLLASAYVPKADWPEFFRVEP